MNKTCFYNARLVDAHTDTFGFLLVAEGKIAAVIAGDFSAESEKKLAESFFQPKLATPPLILLTATV